jgi:hypothetical protein
MEDFVQSPVHFFEAVEAQEALVAMVFFDFPISTGKPRSALRKKAMAQDGKNRRTGIRKKKKV